MLPPPEIKDLELYNAELLRLCKRNFVPYEDLNREHYVKGDLISELFAAEQEALLELPGEDFRVFTLEKVKTDKYSFVHYENNKGLHATLSQPRRSTQGAKCGLKSEHMK